MGVPSIIIGLTVVAIGTSLPELVTAISSARQNVSDLAVGNIIGANVANLTLIVGGAASFNVVTMDRVTQLLNFPALLLGMCIVLWMLCSARRISRREGGILIGYYTVYVALVLGSSFF
jgi:cation:H+ antiporter